LNAWFLPWGSGRIGMLPSFPLGWEGSGLTVPEGVLNAYVANLVHSLRDDGFTRVFALTPQGCDLGLGMEQIMVPQRTHHLAPPHLLDDADRSKVVLIPIGHTEQHGFHLPLSVDTLIIDAIGQERQPRFHRKPAAYR